MSRSINTGFNKILKDFKKLWKKYLEIGDHIATGNLANEMSWDIKLDTRGYHITITLPEYAYYLDKGTKPHWPPVDKIKEWIKVKEILPRPMSNGQLPTTDQLAFLIGRKIAKVGTKPTNIITDTLDDSKLVERLATHISEFLHSEFEEILQD